MVKTNRKIIETSFWKEVCERYGNRKHFSPGDYFVHSGEEMSSVGWVISGSFKQSLPIYSGESKTIGFIISESILADYESVMLAKKMQTDIIALEDSEVIIAPSKVMYDWLICDPTLHIKFIQLMLEHTYDAFIKSKRYPLEQRYLSLINSFPQVIKNLSNDEIASYLGISIYQLKRLIKG